MCLIRCGRPIKFTFTLLMHIAGAAAAVWLKWCSPMLICCIVLVYTLCYKIKAPRNFIEKKSHICGICYICDKSKVLHKICKVHCKLFAGNLRVVFYIDALPINSCWTLFHINPTLICSQKTYVCMTTAWIFTFQFPVFISKFTTQPILQNSR